MTGGAGIIGNRLARSLALGDHNVGAYDGLHPLLPFTPDTMVAAVKAQTIDVLSFVVCAVRADGSQAYSVTHRGPRSVHQMGGCLSENGWILTTVLGQASDQIFCNHEPENALGNRLQPVACPGVMTVPAASSVYVLTDQMLESSLHQRLDPPALKRDVALAGEIRAYRLRYMNRKGYSSSSRPAAMLQTSSSTGLMNAFSPSIEHVLREPKRGKGHAHFRPLASAINTALFAPAAPIEVFWSSRWIIYEVSACLVQAQSISFGRRTDRTHTTGLTGRKS